MMNARQRLIVVRGPGDERERLAALLAAAMPGPAVHVRGDDLGGRWILRGLSDPHRQTETTYRLLRLITITYLKEGFSVVVDASFGAEHGGHQDSLAQEVRDLTRLAHSFRGIDTGVVTLDSPASHPDPADAIDGEVRVVPDLTADEAQTVRAILQRLGM